MKPPHIQQNTGNACFNGNHHNCSWTQCTCKCHTPTQHICCTGECNHDDCCDKIPENCPNYYKETNRPDLHPMPNIIKEQEMEERYNNVFYAGTNPAILEFIKKELDLCRFQLLQEIEERVKNQKELFEPAYGELNQTYVQACVDVLTIITSFK